MVRVLGAALLLAATPVAAQDMRENCVSCGDVKRLCEIDCMLPTYRPDELIAWPSNAPETYNDMGSCLTGCSDSYSSCSETTEQKACLSCIESCSTTYEADMLTCLQAMEDTTSRATVDDSMDDCSTNATYTMSVCSETCYDEDVYHGWTPATEEGGSGDSSVNTAVPNYRSGVSIEDFAAFAQADYSNGIPSYKSPAKMSGMTNMAASPVDEVEEKLSDKLGVGGIVGVSGLVATVMLSVGLLTVNRLKAEVVTSDSASV